MTRSRILVLLRFAIAVSLVCITAAALAQPASVNFRGDSVIVTDAGICSDPFTLGANPMNTLLAREKPRDVQREPVLSRRVEHQIDTALRLAYGNGDVFIIYKWQPDKNTLIHADVETNRFKAKNGITVGMRKTEVMSLLRSYNLSKIPRYLVLQNNGGREMITYVFKDDVLIWFEYVGDY